MHTGVDFATLTAVDDVNGDRQIPCDAMNVRHSCFHMLCLLLFATTRLTKKANKSNCRWLNYCECPPIRASAGNNLHVTDGRGGGGGGRPVGGGEVKSGRGRGGGRGWVGACELVITWRHISVFFCLFFIYLIITDPGILKLVSRWCSSPSQISFAL